MTTTLYRGVFVIPNQTGSQPGCKPYCYLPAGALLEADNRTLRVPTKKLEAFVASTEAESEQLVVGDIEGNEIMKALSKDEAWAKEVYVKCPLMIGQEFPSISFAWHGQPLAAKMFDHFDAAWWRDGTLSQCEVIMPQMYWSQTDTRATVKAKLQANLSLAFAASEGTGKPVILSLNPLRVVGGPALSKQDWTWTCLVARQLGCKAVALFSGLTGDAWNMYCAKAVEVFG